MRPGRNFCSRLHETGAKCLVNCVVPENIHTPTREGIGNSRGVGVKSPGNPEGRGVERINYFPEGKLQFIPM